MSNFVPKCAESFSQTEDEESACTEGVPAAANGKGEIFASDKYKLHDENEKT